MGKFEATEVPFKKNPARGGKKKIGGAIARGAAAAIGRRGATGA